LGLENQDIDIKALIQKGKVEWSIADKLSDLERTRFKGTKLIHVRWGHKAGGEEKIAHYCIDRPEELRNIIK